MSLLLLFPHGAATKPSAGFIRETFRQETGAAFILLVTVEQAQLPAPLRFSSDSVDTASRGETYLAYPFTLLLPRRSSERPPLSRLRIDNIDRQIAETLRSIGDPPAITCEIVMGGSPDIVEAGPFKWTLRNVTGDFFAIEGELEFGTKLLRPWPKNRYLPQTHPGLF